MQGAPAGTTLSFGRQGEPMRKMALFGVVAVAAACSSQKPVARVDDSGLARLDEQQMQPVDDARIEVGRAQDALARSRANEADARARRGGGERDQGRGAAPPDAGGG